jgi:hypothetical protein
LPTPDAWSFVWLWIDCLKCGGHRMSWNLLRYKPTTHADSLIILTCESDVTRFALDAAVDDKCH